MRSFISLLLLLHLTSCSTYTEIGKVNMISNRNIDSRLNYQLLSSYSGSNQREILRSRAPSLEMAIDEVVKKVPGGEFLMNVKMYKISNGKWAVEGDVWGVISESNKVSVQGLKVGDNVVWKRFGKFNSGKITALKGVDKVLVQVDIDNKIVELSYSDLTLINK